MFPDGFQYFLELSGDCRGLIVGACFVGGLSGFMEACQEIVGVDCREMSGDVRVDLIVVEIISLKAPENYSDFNHLFWYFQFY